MKGLLICHVNVGLLPGLIFLFHSRFSLVLHIENRFMSTWLPYNSPYKISNSKSYGNNLDESPLFIFFFKSEVWSLRWLWTFSFYYLSCDIWEMTVFHDPNNWSCHQKV